MKRNKVLSITISFIVAFILMYYILRDVGINSISYYLKNINIYWIIAGLILYTVDMLIRAYRWRYILFDNNIRITLKDAFLAYNLGNTMNILIPARLGDIARSYYLKKKYKYGYSKTLAATFVDRVFDFMGVYIVILLCSIYIIVNIKLELWFYRLMLIGLICLVLVLLGFQVAYNKRDKISTINNSRIKNIFNSLVEIFCGSIREKNKLVFLICCSIIIWICDGLFTFLVFLALGECLNPIIVVFTNMIATLTKVFPITPGGLGVFEGAMVLVFSMFGLKSSLIGIVSTLDHLIMNMYTLVIGIFTVFKEQIKVESIAKERKID